MRCISPLPAGFDRDGNITHLTRTANASGIVGLTLPCRKCLHCRFETSREKSIRCYHEAKMHPDNNTFLTLTYSDEFLESPFLIYEHFQDFMKNLRSHVGYDKTTSIPFMVTGEYGDKNKRPHWHALLFNFRPTDLKPYRSSDLGHPIYTSELIERLWGKNCSKTRPNEIGDVTLESASYVSRYALKKLVHGYDQNHPYQPKHETSKRYALGKSWIESNWKFTFENGFVVLPDGSRAGIPRYYCDWFKKHNPSGYVRYVTQVLPEIISNAEKKSLKEEENFRKNWDAHKGTAVPLRPSKVSETILMQKFKRLEELKKL